MSYHYKAIYNKSADFYNAHSGAKTVLKVANGVLTYGFFVAYLGLWLYGVFLGKFDVRDYARIFFVPVLALTVVSAARLAISRPRPYSKDGAGITPLVVRSGRDGDSCPSRHLACATAIAMTFLPYNPILGSLMLLFSLALGYTRFALGMHYPSDLLAGIGVGTHVGVFIFLL